MPIMLNSEIIQYLFCVYCHADTLVMNGEDVYCQTCGHQFSSVDGILDCRIPNDTALADPGDVAGEPVPKYLVFRQKTIGYDLRQAHYEKIAMLLQSLVPGLEDRLFFFMGTGNGNDVRYLLRKLSFNRVIGFDISPKALIEHREYATKHLDNISIGLVLASNRTVPVKRTDCTLGLAIMTLHHSGDQNEQIKRMLEINFSYLFVSDGRSTPAIRLLEKLKVASRPEGHGGAMKPTTLDLAKLKESLHREGFSCRHRTFFNPPLYFIPEFLCRSFVGRRLVQIGVDFSSFLGKFVGIDKYIDIVIYPRS